jgi:hypothetical protein
MAIQCRNNQVSLDIIKSLIQACHRDLNLFSKYIVKILDMVLETKDIELVDLCCEVVFIIITIYCYCYIFVNNLMMMIVYCLYQLPRRLHVGCRC